MKFLQQLSLYTIAGFFGAGINFFVMPVLSHYLTPYDYGFISIFNTYVTILIPFTGLVAAGSLSVDYYKTKSRHEFASKFVSVQTIPVFPFFFFTVIIWLFYNHLSGPLELGNSHRIWGVIMMVISLATVYNEVFSNFLVIQKKAKAYVIFSVLKVVIEVSITIWLVVFEGWGWQGRLYAWLITSIIFLVISFIYFRKEGFLKGSFKWKYLIEGVIFGLPLILHTVGKFVINQSDRLFIAKMISLDKAGIYNIGYTVGTLILIIINAFFNFYTPFLMERLADLTEQRKLEIVKLSYLFVAGALISLILITLLAPYFFTYFIDKRYSTAGQYVFWVGLGYVFWGAYMLFALFINYFKRNRILGWLAIFNVLVNIIFNYWFITMFGAIGAAYATALSFLIVFIVVAFYANKLIKLPWMRFKKAMLVKL